MVSLHTHVAKCLKKKRDKKKAKKARPNLNLPNLKNPYDEKQRGSFVTPFKDKEPIKLIIRNPKSRYFR